MTEAERAALQAEHALCVLRGHSPVWPLREKCQKCGVIYCDTCAEAHFALCDWLDSSDSTVVGREP